MEMIINNASIILLVVACICTLVSVITQFIKELSWLSTVPTQLVVLLLSEAVTLLTFFAYASYISMAVRWYYILAVIFAGFIIAYITANGWDSLVKLFSRFYKNKDMLNEQKEDK